MWTSNELEKLQKAGKIRGYQQHTKTAVSIADGKTFVIPITPKQSAIMKKADEIKNEIHELLKSFAHNHNMVLLTEHTYVPGRKFRADYALLAVNNKIRILIEYEGILFEEGKKSRHTTLKGFTEDCRKYNLAQLAGFTLLRYTSRNYSEIIGDLTKFLMTCQ